MVILTALSAIAVLSSPIGGDVSQSTRDACTVLVDILAYVPLVMAVRPYCCKLLHFSACCTSKDNRVLQLGGEINEDLHVTEQTPLLGVAEQLDESIKLDIPNYGRAHHTAADRQSARNDRNNTVQGSVIV